MHSVWPLRLGLGLALSVPWMGALAQPGPSDRGFVVNAAKAGDQVKPAVAVAPDGSFVVVWESYPASSRLVVRRFDVSADPITGEIAVLEPGVPAAVPALAMDGTGAFVASWKDGGGVFAQRFDSSANPQGVIRVADWDGYGYLFHDVAMNGGGDFVVVWSDYDGQVFSQFYAGSGVGYWDYSTRASSMADEAQLVHDSNQGGGSPAVVMTDRNGGHVVAWTRNFRESGPPRIHAQRFDREGQRVGATFEVSTDRVAYKNQLDAASAPDGSFVMVWHADSQDGDRAGIFGQRFDDVGKRVGIEFQVNTRTEGNQSQPAVAVGPDGAFFVSWTSAGQDGSREGVFGQRYHRTGTPDGPEFRISAGGQGSQQWPSVAMSARGVVAVWQSDGQTGMGRDILGRRIDDDGDIDGDGVPDDIDNCPTVANPDQTDVAADGFGDDCVSPDVLIPPTARFGFNPTIGQGTVVEDGVDVGNDASIGEFVHLQRQSRAGDRLVIGDFVVVGVRSRLGHGVRIGAGSSIEGGVTIDDAVTIGDRSVVKRNTVIRRGATIGPLVTLFAGAQIGEGATVEMGARVGRRAIVGPGAIVPAGTTVPPGATVP